MVQFAEAFPEGPIVATLSRQSTWSHFVLLLPLEPPLARAFYAEMCRVERWSVRALRQQIDSLIFYNRRLRRIVAVDLKVGAFKAEYKGQMELYLRWLDRHERMSVLVPMETRAVKTLVHFAEYHPETP